MAIYNLTTGKRTRLYAGHSGANLPDAIAPSPDGKWLLTGSVDQTVRFWRLEGCDTLRALLGATLEQTAPGQGKITAVVPGGFAETNGLKAGDVSRSSSSAGNR